jgi:hypothetical protein
MPVINRNAAPRHQHPELVEALATELGKQSEQQENADDPIIYQEAQRNSNSLHVTVLWQRWAGVPNEQRGAIILDAYEKAKKDTLDRIAFALGVTADEAKVLGISFD